MMQTVYNVALLALLSVALLKPSPALAPLAHCGAYVAFADQWPGWRKSENIEDVRTQSKDRYRKRKRNPKR
jgi:hypothetical protein